MNKKHLLGLRGTPSPLDRLHPVASGSMTSSFPDKIKTSFARSESRLKRAIPRKLALHRLLGVLQKISYWYFLFLCIGFAIVAIFTLRQNNLTALRLRDEVLLVDKQNGNTEMALKNLRQFVYAHMNTNLASSTSVYPPIQLKFHYERLLATEKTRVEQARTTLITEATAYCDQNLPQGSNSTGRMQCIQNYVDSHPATLQEQTISDALYKFNFESPLWSPDLAGWSLVLSVWFLIMFLIRFLLNWAYAKRPHPQGD